MALQFFETLENGRPKIRRHITGDRGQQIIIHNPNTFLKNSLVLPQLKRSNGCVSKATVLMRYTENKISVRGSAIWRQYSNCSKGYCTGDIHTGRTVHRLHLAGYSNVLTPSVCAAHQHNSGPVSLIVKVKTTHNQTPSGFLTKKRSTRRRCCYLHNTQQTQCRRHYSNPPSQ
jgi:hypothetical protein